MEKRHWAASRSQTKQKSQPRSLKMAVREILISDSLRCLSVIVAAKVCLDCFSAAWFLHPPVRLFGAPSKIGYLQVFTASFANSPPTRPSFQTPRLSIRHFRLLFLPIYLIASVPLFASANPKPWHLPLGLPVNCLQHGLAPSLGKVDMR